MAAAYINTCIATLEFITCLLPDTKPHACESLPCGAADLQENKGVRETQRYNKRLSARIPVFVHCPFLQILFLS